MEPAPQDEWPEPTPSQRLENRAATLELELERLNRDRTQLREVNARLDVDIERATAVVAAQQQTAARLEEDNERRRRENQILRDKIRAMQALLDGK